MSEDFLGLEQDDKNRDAMRAEGLRLAKLYTVFETDERGRELLKLWDETLMRKRTPTSAPIAEYAANEALRGFVAGIHEQMRISRSFER